MQRIPQDAKILIEFGDALNFDTNDYSRYPSRVPLVARVAQWIERLPPEQEAAGSNPAAGITEIKGPPNRGPFSSH